MEFNEYKNTLKYNSIKSNLNNFSVKIPCINTHHHLQKPIHTPHHYTLQDVSSIFVCFYKHFMAGQSIYRNASSKARILFPK